MFPHEEHLSKALDESCSIYQLMTDLLALHSNRVNRAGSDDEFRKAIALEKAVSDFLAKYYDKLLKTESEHEVH